MDVRRAVSGLGRTLITSGVLILLFVAYQLWGTGLAEQRSQHRLRRELQQALTPSTATAGALTRGSSSASSAGAAPPATVVDPPAAHPCEVQGQPTVGAPSPPPPPSGDAVAILCIPKLGVTKAIVQGVALDDLKKGPGHYPDTPLPGQPGNAAVAGHRTTYGAPFYRLDDLAPGDPILVTTAQGRFRYEVTSSRVVPPSEVSVLSASSDNRLTLTTCNPRFSAAERLIVVAALKGEAALPAPNTGATRVVPGTPGESALTTLPGEVPRPPARSIDGVRDSLSGRRSARLPAILWGLLAAAVWLVAWLVGRVRPRLRWPAYLVGSPIFLVVLFVFFENFSRLLPSNY